MSTPTLSLCIDMAHNLPLADKITLYREVNREICIAHAADPDDFRNTHKAVRLARILQWDISLVDLIPILDTSALMDMSMQLRESSDIRKELAFNINNEINIRQTSEVVPDEVTEEDINYFESQLPR